MKILMIIILTLTMGGILVGCAQEKASVQMDDPGTQEIEPTTSSEPDSERTEDANMEVGTMTFIGRASVKINLKSGAVVYIDPYAGTPDDYKEPADLVLVTHQHGDHNKVNLVTLKTGGKVIQCPKDIQAGKTLESHRINIEAVAAYNKNHPKESSCGYVLTMDGLKFYHSGDTSKIDEMKSLKDFSIDYALMCMDGYYNMGPKEALEATGLIQPKHVIPIHTSADGMYDQKNVDAFSSSLKVDLKPGETTALIK